MGGSLDVGVRMPYLLWVEGGSTGNSLGQLLGLGLRLRQGQRFGISLERA